MASQKTLLLAGLGAIAGYTAFKASQVSSITSALAVLFIAGWFLYGFKGLGSAWNLIGLFKNPFMAAILVAGLGFSYWTLKGNSFADSGLFSLGMLFIGAAFGMLAYVFWNIGS
ncbi:MAG: hypothetical protein ABEJ93_02920 [Candidatus Nanohalobium sp.]